MSLVVEVVEVEGFAEAGIVQLVEHLAQAEVVVDVEGDAVQHINAQAGLHAPSDGFGVEFLVGRGVMLVHFVLLAIDGIGLVVHGLRLQDEVGGGACLCTQLDDVEVDYIEADHNGHLQVHLVQREVQVGSGGEVEQVVALNASNASVKDVGGLEIKHLGLHINAAEGDAAKDTSGEVVGETGFDVGFVVR